MDPAKGIELLRVQRDRGRKLLSERPIDSAALSTWADTTHACIEKSFGKSSSNIVRFLNAGRPATAVAWGRDTDSDTEKRLADAIERQIAVVNSCVEQLKNDIETAETAAPPPKETEGKSFGTDVFLVHGQDEGTRDTVARFLEGLVGREHVVILHKRPNKGRTIIEKFEDYSDVGFAVVLLTPDDEGQPRGQPAATLKRRARQNVIFELGFFLGKLGRSKVCPLYKGNVELPSDYRGVLFVPLDNEGSWRLELAKEIKDAGIQADLNNLL